VMFVVLQIHVGVSSLNCLNNLVVLAGGFSETLLVMMMIVLVFVMVMIVLVFVIVLLVMMKT
jgi:hypothetical protein